MSNFLLKNPDCVLIHIPKTGGTSIRKGAWAKRVRGPRFGHIPEPWADLFKFAFMREPLDRFLSAYRMFTTGTEAESEWNLPRDARPLTHSEFFDIVRDEDFLFNGKGRRFEDRIRHHTIPQTHPFNCLRMADFIGRFETLDADFARIARHVGMTAALPHMHITARAPVDAVAILGSALAGAVAAYYGEDRRFLDQEIGGYRRLA